MKARLACIVALFPLSLPAAFAQSPEDPELPVLIIDAEEASLARHAARQEILATARAGDFATVRQRVTADIADRRTLRSNDVDLAEELASVSFNLDEVGEPDAATRVSELARAVLARVQRERNRAEAVWATFVEATLWERVHHDAVKARAAYEQALELDPECEAAREGLARLALADAITGMKRQEQEQLLDEREAAEAQR